MSKLLSRQDILAVSDLVHEDVPVPAWGGTVRIRVMTGTERDAFRSEVAARRGDRTATPVGEFSAILLAWTCVDGDGNRIFTVDDVEQLRLKSAGSLDGPADVAVRLNALGVTAVTDAAKNSESNQSDDSGSSSPAT